MKFDSKKLTIFWFFFLFIYILLKLSFSIAPLLDSILFSFLSGYFFSLLFLFLFLFVNSFIYSKGLKEIKISLITLLFSVVFGVLFFIFVFNSSLYVRALIGNDLFLSLSLDKEVLDLKNGENFSIVSSFGVITNPFCSSDCVLSLVDLDSGEKLFSENKNLYISKHGKKTFDLNFSDSTFGQKLFRVEFSCLPKKNFFCHVKNDREKFVSRVFILKHSLNDEQEILFSDLNRTLHYLNEKHFYLSSILESFSEVESGSLNLSHYDSDIENLSKALVQNNLSYENSLFSNQEFFDLEISSNRKYSSLREVEIEINNLNSSLNEEISRYNLLANNFSFIFEDVKRVYSSGVDFSSLENLNSLVEQFNLSASDFLNLSNLEDKEKSFGDFYKFKQNLSFNYNETNRTFSNYPLFEPNFSIINFSWDVPIFNFKLEKPSPLCCAFSKCGPCGEFNSSSNYPIIFVHGHSFNSEVSVLSSLNSLNKFQRELEKEGYFNAGNFIYSDFEEENMGLLGNMNFPVTFSISYYLLPTEDETFLLNPSLSEVEDYAIRLNKYVEKIKLVTGKDKVVLVSYSLGGLVSRRYLQLFGEDSVDKLILLTVPNYGVDGIVDKSCSVFGASKECKDLSSSSSFLQNLNSQTIPKIPVYNIIGKGCSMEGEEGDGIVKIKSSFLPFAVNRYFEGSCEGVSFLHEKVLEPNLVPEGFELVKKFIKE